MIIDWHTHVHSPEEQAEPHYRGQCPATIDNVLRLHDEVGLDLSVISNSGHYLKKFTRDEALSFIRGSNEYLASLRDRHKDKIIAIATAIPGGGDAASQGARTRGAAERSARRADQFEPSRRLSRTMRKPGRSFSSRPSSTFRFHASASVGFGEERMREFRLASSVGRPFDSCLALARLIVNGVFEDFPQLKFVASHLGGGICEIIGRMDYAYELRDDPVILGPYGPPLHITRKPSDYLRMIYFDTVCYHAPAVECAINTVGADRLIFGTDSPMLIALKQRGLDLVRQLDLGAADKEKVLSGTARMLLKALVCQRTETRKQRFDQPNGVARSRLCVSAVGARARHSRGRPRCRFLSRQDHHPSGRFPARRRLRSLCPGVFAIFYAPHPGQSTDRDQEYAGRERHYGGRIHDDDHAARWHFAWHVSRRADAWQGAGRSGRF